MVRCLFVLALVGCGRLGFDPGALTSSDGGDAGGTDGPAANSLAIHDPPDNAEVGATAHLTGGCIIGVQIQIAGSGLDTAVSLPCPTGTFGADIIFTTGFGPKVVVVMQGASSVSRTFQRVASAIGVRSTRSGQTPSAGFMVDCDLVLDRPLDLADGDLVIGMIYTDGGNGSVSTPTFTRLTLDGPTFVGFFKIANNEPATYTFHIVAGTGPADTCGSGGALVAFTNVDPASPIDTQSAATAVDRTTIIAPSVIASSGTMLVGLFGSNGPASGITAPASMTFNSDAMPAGSQGLSASGFGDALIAWQTIAAGTSGERAATVSTPTVVAGGLVALRPR